MQCASQVEGGHIPYGNELLIPQIWGNPQTSHMGKEKEPGLDSLPCSVPLNTPKWTHGVLVWLSFPSDHHMQSFRSLMDYGLCCILEM